MSCALLNENYCKNHQYFGGTVEVIIDGKSVQPYRSNATQVVCGNKLSVSSNDELRRSGALAKTN